MITSLSFFLLLAFFANINAEDCKDGVCSISFPRFNLPDTIIKDKKPITLVSAGMRRKNLFVVEVDVYSVGIYLSAQKEKDVSASVVKSNEFKLAEPVKNDDGVSVAIVLNFVRDVATNKVVDAIVEALSASADEVFTSVLGNFKTLLVSGIGAGGVKKNDDNEFSLRGKQGTNFEISYRGKVLGTISSSLLREKIVAIYTGSKPLVPDVITYLKSRFSSK